MNYSIFIICSGFFIVVDAANAIDLRNLHLNFYHIVFELAIVAGAVT